MEVDSDRFVVWKFLDWDYSFAISICVMVSSFTMKGKCEYMWMHFSISGIMWNGRICLRNSEVGRLERIGTKCRCPSPICALLKVQVVNYCRLIRMLKLTVLDVSNLLQSFLAIPNCTVFLKSFSRLVCICFDPLCLYVHVSHIWLPGYLPFYVLLSVECGGSRCTSIFDYIFVCVLFCRWH